jgi:hypothetical protein
VAIRRKGSKGKGKKPRRGRPPTGGLLLLVLKFSARQLPLLKSCR